MPIWRYGPRVRVADLQPGMRVLMRYGGRMRAVIVDRVRPIDDIYTAVHAAGTMWQMSPRYMVTTVVPAPDEEALSAT